MPQRLLSRAQWPAGARAVQARGGGACVIGRLTTDPLFARCPSQLLQLAVDQHTAPRGPFAQSSRSRARQSLAFVNRADRAAFLGQLRPRSRLRPRYRIAARRISRPTKTAPDLRTQTADRNHIAELERSGGAGLLRSGAANRIRYASPRSTRIQRLRKSFEHRRRVRGGAGKTLRYDVGQTRSTVDWTSRPFPHEHRSPTHDAHRTPIHVGLPRSGTTLVDRILSSHSPVRSAGELNDFALALNRPGSASKTKGPVPRRELVARSPGGFRCTGPGLSRARDAVGVAEVPLYRKMPPTTVIRIVRRALPDAKIVHLNPSSDGRGLCHGPRRCVGRFIRFSYDLDAIAHNYSPPQAMDHWSAAMPGASYSLNYEKSVADPDRETRSFSSIAASTGDSSPSFHAIRPPPHRQRIAGAASDFRLVGAQWRHSGRQLAPLSSAFESRRA